MMESMGTYHITFHSKYPIKPPHGSLLDSIPKLLGCAFVGHRRSFAIFSTGSKSVRSKPSGSKRTVCQCIDGLFSSTIYLLKMVIVHSSEEWPKDNLDHIRNKLGYIQNNIHKYPTKPRIS